MNLRPETDDALVDERYRRLVRRARLKDVPRLWLIGGSIYWPIAQGSVRFCPGGQHSWQEGLHKTLVWLVTWSIIWSLPMGRAVQPSGFTALSRADRTIVERAIANAEPLDDPLLRRVADERARLAMRRAETRRQAVVALVLLAVATAVLATHVWVAALWSLALAWSAWHVWAKRGSAGQTERYLTASRECASSGHGSMGESKAGAVSPAGECE